MLQSLIFVRPNRWLPWPSHLLQYFVISFTVTLRYYLLHYVCRKSKLSFLNGIVKSSEYVLVDSAVIKVLSICIYVTISTFISVRGSVQGCL